MGRLFISHSSQDDAIVRALQQALGELGQDVWIDSRELRGGDPLSPEIQRAIEGAEAFAVVVSPSSLRHRLPNTRDLDVAVVAPPIRVLVVCPRPEDDACRYFDHRASALPLVDAMEQLPGLVELHILAPPTLPALREELDRARREGEPYHVLHFDGHGVYDRRVGLGGLCFEHPEDESRLVDRRRQTIFTSQLGPLLRDHRIPLVDLDACQTAQAEQASESVASAMLEQGVASVVAMTHSVLVETARRFVTAFYAALARGSRVGAAMLEAQRHLKDDTLRGRIFGASELRLEDWFVPVLYQEKEDPQLFRQMPAKRTQADFHAGLQNRLGALPPPPPTGFIGRGRDLLALERLLHRERYAVLRGQGGEGKTALAAELARWMVCSQRFRRAAFVSVEEHSTVRAVLDALGRQLMLDSGYSAATFASIDQAEQPVVRALIEQPTLLVVDNLESILRPPYLAADMPESLAEDAAASRGRSWRCATGSYATARPGWCSPAARRCRRRSAATSTDANCTGCIATTPSSSSSAWSTKTRLPWGMPNTPRSRVSSKRCTVMRGR